MLTENDVFYEQVMLELNKTSNRDVIIITGDLKAKIGQDNTGNENAMGKHGN